jgi:hypothetical protein
MPRFEIRFVMLGILTQVLCLSLCKKASELKGKRKIKVKGIFRLRNANSTGFCYLFKCYMGIAGYVSVCLQLYCTLVFTVFQ